MSAFRLQATVCTHGSAGICCAVLGSAHSALLAASNGHKFFPSSILACLRVGLRFTSRTCYGRQPPCWQSLVDETQACGNCVMALVSLTLPPSIQAAGAARCFGANGHERGRLAAAQANIGAARHACRVFTWLCHVVQQFNFVLANLEDHS